MTMPNKSGKYRALKHIVMQTACAEESQTVAADAGLQQPKPRQAAKSGDIPQSDPLLRRLLPEVDHRTVGEILVHPDFARMRRCYVPDTIANYESAVFPGGWQSAAYRTAALGAIVCLWANFDEANRATWPTLALFKRAVSTFGFSSPRQIDDFVRRLTETGHIVQERVVADGRLRLLKPTEKLLAWDREVIAPYYEALQLLYPEPGYGLPIARDPEFHLAQRRCAVEIFPVIGNFLREIVELLPFYNMYQGLNVLLMLADRQATDPDKSMHERDLTEIQHRFRTSRSHIRNIITTAEASGLIIWTEGSRRRFAATPQALAATDLFIAYTLASHDLTYRMAMKEMGRDPGALVY